MKNAVMHLVIPAALSIPVFWVYNFSYESLLYIVYTACLFVITISDIKNFTIPNEVLLIIFVTWIGFQPLLSHGKGYILVRLCTSTIYFVSLLLIILISEKALGKKIIGAGDLKLIGIAVLYVGAVATIFVTLFSCLSCLVFIVFERIFKISIKKHFPFGPFIAISTYCVLLYRRELIEWFLSV